jgi:glycosyltransferase involved in cell wall biosynthesis
MRVLMFGWEFPPYNSGGLGTACQGLCDGLIKEGAEIIFVLPRRLDIQYPGLSFLFAGTDRFRLHTIDSPLYPYLDAKDYEALGLTGGYGNGLIEEVLRYGTLARTIAKNEHFDVIHAHDWLSFPAGIAAQEVSGKPLIVHVHATEFDRTGGPQGINPTVYQIEKRGLEKANAVVAVSGFTKNILEKEYGTPSLKINVVHNATEAVPPSSNLCLPLAHLKEEGKKVVLFVGRLTLQKGPDYFLRAARRVLDIEPKTIFVIAGSGDMEGQVIRDTATLGLGDHVFFTGFARGEELAGLYELADLFVLSSVSEPFGITPLEALSHGTPVIVSKQSGVSEVLSHALKVDFWDTEEMANQIISILRNNALSSQLSKEGKKEVAGISWQDAAKKCLDLYGRFINHLE